MADEAVSYCDLEQNLETVQFLVSKKDLELGNSAVLGFKEGPQSTQIVMDIPSFTREVQLLVFF